MRAKKTKSRWSPVATAAVVLVLVTGLAAAQPPSAQLQEEANRRLVERFVQEVLDPGEIDRLEEFLDPESAIAFRKGEQLRRSLFPDLAYEVVDLVVEGDRVVVRYKLSGTHSGDKPGLPAGHHPLPPTHRLLEVEEVALYTVTGGKLEQRWLSSDRMAVAQALGYTVTPPPGPAEEGDDGG